MSVLLPLLNDSSNQIGGVGYSLGTGGAVTQLTSKSTGVTLNKLTGQITMNGAALGNTTAVQFTVTDNQVNATDTVVVALASGSTSAYLVGVSAVAAGSFQITVYNVSGGSLSEALVLNFAVIRGESS